MVALSLHAVPEKNGMSGTAAPRSGVSGAVMFGAADGADQTPATRAITPGSVEEGTDPEYKVSDFWLIQYNHLGEQISSARYYEKSEFESGTLSVPVILPADGITYKCVIIANTHSEGFGTTLKTATTLDKLRALYREITVQNDFSITAADGKRDLLMNCVVDITSATTELNCDLYRNIAKLTLTLTNDAKSNVTIKSVQLRNVPNRLFYADQVYNDDATPSPTVQESGFIDMEIEACELPAGGEPVDLVYYLPRNRRGASGADRIEDKNRNAPDYATFVEIMAEDATAHTPLRYRFYLGRNMTNDFNIIPNHHYKLPVTILTKGDADADSRVEDMSHVELASANSYIVNPANSEAQTVYSVPIVRINQFWRHEAEEWKIDPPIGPDTKWVAEVIWQDQAKRLITFCSADGLSAADTYAGTGEAYFHFRPEPGANGNVLIGVRFKDAPKTEYLWSWHLWITDYNPEYTASWQDEKYAYTVPGGEVHRYQGSTWENNYKNKYIMDRNLGALAVSYQAHGIYYQFGRKDPFPYTETKLYDIKGDPQQNFTASDNDCIVLTQGVAQLTTATQRPYVFYCSGSNDWMMDNAYPKNLWNNPIWHTDASGSDKSFFDPCPPGWRVSPNGWIIGLSTSNGYWSGGWHLYLKANGTTGDETTYYPAHSARSGSSGLINEHGGIGFCWSNLPTSDVTMARFMDFRKTYIHPYYDGSRSMGCSVRCIQE